MLVGPDTSEKIDYPEGMLTIASPRLGGSWFATYSEMIST